MTLETASASRIEQHTIYPIPLAERHGRARDLFTLWFGSNIMILTIVTGALATITFKLTLLCAILAIVIGNLVGGIFMALHAAQGPQLGVPQMVQSRGQFGAVGAVFVVALVVVMYVGFVASDLVLGGQSLRSIAPFVSDQIGIVVIAGVSVGAAIYGYDLIHSYGRLMTWMCGAALFASFAWIVLSVGLPADLWQRGSLTVSGFLGTLSVGALWQIAYAPYVSDYSRYMPVDSGVRPTFWASYAGCVLGSLLPMLLGALLGLLVPDGDVAAGLAQITGPLSIPIVGAFSVGIGATIAMNIYCCVLSTITVGQTFRPGWKAASRARIALSLLLMLAALAMALWGADNFLVKYENFLALLLCAMTPWTAINLVDFYLVQHGHYDVDAFFAADGGIYGRYNAVALFCYGGGILVQLPFLATDLYTGPIAAALGGTDISWLVGLGLVSPIYFYLARLAGRSDLAEAASK
jgi:NCS1 family nucleobase:cation symporter-1